MLKKYYKIVIFICLFSLFVSISSNLNIKKVYATENNINSRVAIVDDVTLMLILGTVVTATGINAISKGQLSHMGSIVYDKFKEIGGDVSDLVVDAYNGVKGLKIGDKLKEAVRLAFTDIPTVDYYESDYMLFPSEGITVGVASFPEYTYPSGGYNDKDFYNTSTRLITIYYTGEYRVNGVLQGSKYFSGYTTYASCTVDGQKKIYLWKTDDVGNLTGSWFSNISSNIDSLTFTGSIRSVYVHNRVGYGEPVVWENANVEKLDTSIPYTDTNVGFIPFPSDTTIYDDITVDVPLTWDKIQDTVIDFPVDKVEDDDVVIPPITGDGTVDDTITGDGVIDGVIDGITGVVDGVKDFLTGLWELLKGLLSGILELLQSILDFLLSLLENLLIALKDLLLSLFVPSDTYFIDSFDKIKGNFSSKLSYNSYIDLFNQNYDGGPIKDITINIFGQEVTIVKFTIYEHFRDIINTLIYAFFFFLLSIYNYSQVYKLIRGSDYVSASSTITHMGGGMTHNDVLKADSISQRTQRMFKRGS